jgi:glycerophosphoryl diester phosphodiesterase
LIKEEGIIDNVEIQAFDWACLQALQKLDHRIRTAYLTEAYNECADPGSPDYSHSFFNPDPHLAGLWTGGKLLKDYQNSIPRMVKALGGTNWEPEDAELTKEALDEAHALGLKVCTWTYPEHTGKAFDVSMIQKIIDWGVDGVITDDPGYLISILAAKGYPVPRRFDAR